MTSGISTSNTNAQSGAQRKPKPNGHARSDAIPSTKELTPAPKSMENLLAQFMSLDGVQLRAVFDKAIADHNARVEEEKANYHEEVSDINDSIDVAQAEIDKHTQAIADAKNRIQDMYALRQERQETNNAALDKLDEGRALIENMMQLFKHKLDGFAE